MLTGMGYEVVRQWGSHVRLRKTTPAGEHNITVPDHDEMAQGTLNDILSSISIWNSVHKEDLIKTLRGG
ncbi:MAG: addiction module toxin, HicA family [Thermoplasmata archaeon]|nr:addiction module toxin, HicA family [Thermoplasmata archaeon]